MSQSKSYRQAKKWMRSVSVFKRNKHKENCISDKRPGEAQLEYHIHDSYFQWTIACLLCYENCFLFFNKNSDYSLQFLAKFGALGNFDSIFVAETRLRLACN